MSFTFHSGLLHGRLIGGPEPERLIAPDRCFVGSVNIWGTHLLGYPKYEGASGGHQNFDKPHAHTKPAETWWDDASTCAAAEADLAVASPNERNLGAAGASCIEFDMPARV